MPAAMPPISWLMPRIMSQDVFQDEVAGIVCPWVHSGPTPLAVARDQMTGACVSVWSGCTGADGIRTHANHPQAAVEGGDLEGKLELLRPDEQEREGETPEDDEAHELVCGRGHGRGKRVVHGSERRPDGGNTDTEFRQSKKPWWTAVQICLRSQSTSVPAFGRLASSNIIGRNQDLHCTAHQMKLSRMRCSNGM